MAALCSAHTAVCSSPRASRTLFLLLAAEAILTVSLLRGFFKLDLKGLFILAENNSKVNTNSRNCQKWVCNIVSQNVNSPLDETVEPKLKTESWFEFKLSMDPRLEPACLWLASSPGLCLPPGLRSTLSSLGGGARRLGATAATGAE